MTFSPGLKDHWQHSVLLISRLVQTQPAQATPWVGIIAGLLLFAWISESHAHERVIGLLPLPVKANSTPIRPLKPPLAQTTSSPSTQNYRSPYAPSRKAQPRVPDRFRYIPRSRTLPARANALKGEPNPGPPVLPVKRPQAAQLLALLGPSAYAVSLARSDTRRLRRVQLRSLTGRRRTAKRRRARSQRWKRRQSRRRYRRSARGYYADWPRWASRAMRSQN